MSPRGFRFLAISAIVLAMTIPALAQIGPPPVMCLASITGVNVPAAATLNWIAQPPPGGWSASWQWTTNFDCPAGGFTNCTVVATNVAATWNPTLGNWNPPANWCTMGGFQACGNSYQSTFTTTWPSAAGAAPGTVFQIYFFAGPYNSANGTQCNTQVVTLYAKQQYTLPPAP